jgi:hypothetical protein
MTKKVSTTKNSKHPDSFVLGSGVFGGAKKESESSHSSILPLFVTQLMSTLNLHIMDLNSSKYFAGLVMIMMNLGAKLVPVHFSKSTAEYLKGGLSKNVFVFSMSWMGTRDIYTSIILTIAFVVLSDYLFNEESSVCIVPEKYRVLHSLVDSNNDGVISEEELVAATQVLEKARNAAKKQFQEQKQQNERK